MDFLNYFCGGWVFPADGGGDLLQLFRIELEALRFDRSFYRSIVAIHIIVLLTANHRLQLLSFEHDQFLLKPSFAIE